MSRINAAIDFLNKHPKDGENLKMVIPSFIGSVGMIYMLGGTRINLTFLSRDKVEVSVIDESGRLSLEEQMQVEDIKSIKQFLFKNG